MTHSQENKSDDANKDIDAFLTKKTLEFPQCFETILYFDSKKDSFVKRIWLKDWLTWHVEVCKDAAKLGRCDVLEWVRQLNNLERKSLFEIAWTHGCNRTEVLQWCIKSGFKCKEKHTRLLIRKGKYDILKWIYENGGRIAEDDIAYGILNFNGPETKRLEFLKYLHSIKYPLNPIGPDICADAAMLGQIEILKWAHENGLPWDNRVCVTAANAGHLDILIWARERGCPWNSCVLVQAEHTNHFELAK